MVKDTVIRVRPKAFDTDWQADLRAVGIRIPETVPETGYTPVNHDPMPYSLTVDLGSGCLVRRIVGVIPNAICKEKTCSWEEFCGMLEKRRD